MQIFSYSLKHILNIYNLEAIDAGSPIVIF